MPATLWRSGSQALSRDGRSGIPMLIIEVLLPCLRVITQLSFGSGGSFLNLMVSTTLPSIRVT